MNSESGTAQNKRLDRAVIFRRIETITQELSELRRMLANAFPPEPRSSLTSELLGCLGPESLDDYDYWGDWRRFDPGA